MDVTSTNDYDVRSGRRGLRHVVLLNGGVIATGWTQRSALRQAADLVGILERLFHIRVLAAQYDDLGPA